MSHWIDGGKILESVFARLQERGKFTIKDLKHELSLQLNDYGTDEMNSSQIHEKINKAANILLNKIRFKEEMADAADVTDVTDVTDIDTK